MEVNISEESASSHLAPPPEEESMWQTSFRVGVERYPQRPGESDCTYYLMTGYCKFGMSCRFSHPPDRKLDFTYMNRNHNPPKPACRWSAARILQLPKQKKSKENLQTEVVDRMKRTCPERIGQPECQFYLKYGICKFGPTCKYHHPKVSAGITKEVQLVQLNSLGYPLRPNAKDCEYYLATGRCKFHKICRYNHPEPSNTKSFVLSPTTFGQQSHPGGITSFIASPHYQDPSSYAQQSNPQGMARLPSWNTFPENFEFDLSQQQKSGIGQFAGTSHQSIRAMGSSASFSSQFGSSPEGKSSLQRGSIFPVRHGEPDCPFFIKTGDCKFGAMCRFHHPIEKLIRSPDCMLNPNGFPLRPGKPQCVFYSRHGTCKYGPTCKFDHPIAAPKGTVTASLSTSSSSDVPVVRRVLGSSSRPPPALSLVSESSAIAGPSTSRRLPSSKSCK